jgi:hypothetical protein
MEIQALDFQEPAEFNQNWETLLEEMRREYLMSEELTEDQNRFLDGLEATPEEEWQPIPCIGESVAETIIGERGMR